MTARLRVLFVTAETHLLVIDRLGSMPHEQIDSLIRGTRAPAVQGTLVFPFEVDLPDAGTEGIEVHADERAALRWVADFVRLQPTDTGKVHAETLDLLLARIEERL